MDPVTAALQAFAAALRIAEVLVEAASPLQKQEMVQNALDTQRFWTGVVSKICNFHGVQLPPLPDFLRPADIQRPPA